MYRSIRSSHNVISHLINEVFKCLEKLLYCSNSFSLTSVVIDGILYEALHETLMFWKIIFVWDVPCAYFGWVHVGRPHFEYAIDRAQACDEAVVYLFGSDRTRHTINEQAAALVARESVATASEVFTLSLRNVILTLMEAKCVSFVKGGSRYKEHGLAKSLKVTTASLLRACITCTACNGK